MSFLSRRALSFLTANIMPSVRFFFAVFSAFLLFFRMIYRRNHVTQPALNQLFTLSKSFERAYLGAEEYKHACFVEKATCTGFNSRFFVNDRCLQPVHIHDRAYGVSTLMVVQLSVSLLRGPTCKSRCRPVFSLWKLLKLCTLFVFFSTWVFFFGQAAPISKAPISCVFTAQKVFFCLNQHYRSPQKQQTCPP